MRVPKHINWVKVLAHVAGWAGFHIFSIIPFYFLKQKLEAASASHKVTLPFPLGSSRTTSYENAFVFYDTLMTIDTLANVILICMFYLFYFMFIPKLLLKKKLFPFVVVSIVALAAYVLSVLQISNVLATKLFAMENQPIPHHILVVKLVTNFGFAIGFLLITVFYSSWEREKRKIFQLENEFLSSELALLRSQLSPHFLFNTLNNLRYLIRGNAKNSEEVLLQLSDILRYVTYESSNELIRLDKELEFVNNLIDLQLLRLDPKSIVNCVVDTKVVNMMIPPLLVIPLVENVFKHGGTLNEGLQAEISIDMRSKDRLQIKVKNNFESQPSAYLPRIGSGGVGLSNLNRRLRLLFGEDYVLTSFIDSQWYKVELSFPCLVPLTV